MKRKFWGMFMWRLMVVCALLGPLLCVAAPPAHAQADEPPLPDATSAPMCTVPPVDADPLVVRVYFTSREQLHDLAAQLDVWEVQHDAGYLVAQVWPTRADLLRAEGYTVVTDYAKTEELNRPQVWLPGQLAGIPGYPCYRTVEETFAAAEAIVAAHPNLASWIDIGDSWEKVQPGGAAGYDLMVLRMTNAAISGPKPALFVVTGLHAREYTPPELALRFAESLAANYDSDPDVTWILDYHELHFLFAANPDGRKHAETGLSWRKNTNSNYCASQPNSRGADLNRNFAFQWNCCGGSSGTPCNDTYRGPTAASEPETQAIQNYARQIFPDQREPPLGAAAPVTATGIFLDIHSYSNLVLWAWGFDDIVAPNGTALQTLGRKFAYFNNYTPQQAYDLYATDGATDDFAYGDLGVAAYTFELGTSFFQSCSYFESTILPGNLPALLYAAKVVRTPYLTPAGPDTLNVQVSVASVSAGDPAQLTATVNDTRYNNQNGTEPTQNIVAAEYYRDTPPWVTSPAPVAYPMQPSDGSFNSKTEGVVATVDTTGWPAGRHTLYVRGQDVSGSWGPVSAVFITVTMAADSAITGVVQDIATTTPLAGAEVVLTGGAFTQTLTTAATGVYTFQVFSGTYTVSASAYGYQPLTVPGVQAVAGVTTTQPLNLTPLPAGFIAGEVYALGTAQPLAATITAVSAYTTLQTTTDPATGRYALPAFSGAYTVTAVARGYDPATVQLTVQAGLTTTQHFTLQPKACLLLVDDDGGKQAQATYQADLAALGVDFATWTVATAGSPTLADLSDYRHTLWLTGDRFQSTLVAADQAALGAYLDDGGNLLLSSWGAGSDLTVNGAAFLAGYLRASHGGDVATGVLPLAGQGAFAGDTLTVTATAAMQVSKLTPAGGATRLYNLPAPHTTAAALGYAGDYNLAYLGFGLETVSDTAARRETLAALLDWLGPCPAAAPPAASFISNSPVRLGQALVFTNTTATASAATYAWDFGDGVGASTAMHPAYTYTATGTYTVTLTAMNAGGDHAYQAFVEVLPGFDHFLYLPLVLRADSASPAALLLRTR